MAHVYPVFQEPSIWSRSFQRYINPSRDFSFLISFFEDLKSNFHSDPILYNKIIADICGFESFLLPEHFKLAKEIFLFLREKEMTDPFTYASYIQLLGTCQRRQQFCFTCFPDFRPSLLMDTVRQIFWECPLKDINRQVVSVFIKTCTYLKRPEEGFNAFKWALTNSNPKVNYVDAKVIRAFKTMVIQTHWKWRQEFFPFPCTRGNEQYIKDQITSFLRQISIDKVHLVANYEREDSLDGFLTLRSSQEQEPTN